MNQYLLLVVFGFALAFPALAERPAPTSADQEKVGAAQKILAAWRTADSESVTPRLHVVYWTPADREPAPGYRDRLSRTMRDIQVYYGKEMSRLGFGNLQPNLDFADDGLLRIHMVKSKRPYKEFDVKSGHAIRDEADPVLKEAGIDYRSATIVIFTNMSNWDPDTRRISQNSPYYASGTHLNGTAWQVDSPILDVASILDKGNFVRDGQYGRMSLGAYNSMFIGGIAHEIGHALGLPHIRETPANKKRFGTALMGSGNRTYGQERRGEGKGSFLTLAHGLRLATHPLFCGEGKRSSEAVTSTLSEVVIDTQPSQVTLSGHLDSSIPCYAVLAYWDPEGGSDYDAISAVAIPNEQGHFTLSLTELPPKSEGQLRLVPLFANGAAGSFSFAGHTKLRYAFTLDDTRTAKLRCLHCEKK